MFESFDEAAWQKAIDLSLMSHVRLIKAALPHLRQSKVASVLTVTSYSVKQTIPNLVLSNSIRAATVGLTKSLALELGKNGIRFNSILPSWTETECVAELMSFRAKQNGTTVEAEIAKQSKDSPLGRMGTRGSGALSPRRAQADGAPYLALAGWRAGGQPPPRPIWGALFSAAGQGRCPEPPG